jgi:regulator of protease activity HflC (stomatin/prohibitin superfamily)
MKKLGHIQIVPLSCLHPHAMTTVARLACATAVSMATSASVWCGYGVFLAINRFASSTLRCNILVTQASSLNRNSSINIQQLKPRKNMRESEAIGIDGFVAVIIFIIVAAVLILLATTGAVGSIVAMPLGFALLFCTKGFVVLNPGMAVVTTCFGNYSGTWRTEGFSFINPLASRQSISVKLANLATPQLKVNDSNGNPIEVAASIVWEVADTARATFSVDNYDNYMRVQAESGLRQLASTHPYEGGEGKSLRSDVEAVTKELIAALNAVVKEAGLRVTDARITHLAYAPEIAQAMLRKQGAQQIIMARQTIVDGAVDLVASVIEKLRDKKVVELSQEDAARLVVNLLTVMVSETDAQPTLPMK